MSNVRCSPAREPQSVSTNAKRQARFVESQRALGLVRCSVWLPVSEVDGFRESAEELVAAHIRRQVLGDWTDRYLGGDA